MSVVRRSLFSKAFDYINYIILSMFVIVTVYPFYYCVMLSFNDGKDAQMGGIYFWPRVFTFANYVKVFAEPLILTAARNTVLRTSVGTAAAVFFTAMFAYGVSRPNLHFKKFYMIFGTITMYFGGGLIPYFLLIRSLGLMNNFLVYIIPGMFSIWNAIIFISFFKSLPEALEESAKIDGANEFYIFLRIILPLSTPVLATIALFVGVWQWSSWYDTMLFANSEKLETLPHILMNILNTQSYLDNESAKGGVAALKALKKKGVTSSAMQLAIMVVTTFPIIAVYPFLQKYFVKGVMIGSIKG